MPPLTLADALRYFFSPFVLYFYLAVYDKQFVLSLTRDFGLSGMVAFLVAGSVIYFVYRNIIFDYLIKWVHDILRKQTYRRFFQTKYKISQSQRWYPWHSARAERFVLHLQVGHIDEKWPNPWLSFRQVGSVRFSGIHFLYQAGLLAIPFILMTLINHALLPALFFTLLAVIFIAAAVLQDIIEEDDELAIIRNVPEMIDDAARLLGIAPQE